MTYPSFSAGEVLTAADMNAVGMWKVATVTFSGSSGVEVQNCFSSAYSNYFIQIVYYGSAASNTQMQYMTGTNTKDIANTYNRFGFYYSNALFNFQQAGTTSDFVCNHSAASTDPSTVNMFVYSPTLPTRTMSSSQAYSGDSGLTTFLSFNKVTTSNYTGLYLFPTSGTITGTITVYGMRN